MHLISIWNVATNVGLCIERLLVLSFRNCCFLHVDVQIIVLIKLSNSQKENIFPLPISLCCTFKDYSHSWGFLVLFLFLFGLCMSLFLEQKGKLFTNKS